MFAWKNTAWGQGTNSDGAMPQLAADTTGLIAGTKVATSIGWRKVEAVAEGDQVLTFDGGLQTVVAITRHYVSTAAARPTDWPMNVPAGVLGNREDMQILPAQAIMIESDTAEEVFGDPFALISGAALDGFRGITASRPAEWVEIIELHFARDEIVFANIGALFLCRAKADLLSDAPASDYAVLCDEDADMLVDCLDLDHAPATNAAPVQPAYAAA